MHRAGGHVFDPLGALHTGRSNEPMPLRVLQRPQPGVQLHAADHSATSRRSPDRIDIHIDVPAVQYKELRSASSPGNSPQIRDRVSGADNAIGKIQDRQNLLQRADGTTPDSGLLQVIRRLRTLAGESDDPARSYGPST